MGQSKWFVGPCLLAQPWNDSYSLAFNSTLKLCVEAVEHWHVAKNFERLTFDYCVEDSVNERRQVSDIANCKQLKNKTIVIGNARYPRLVRNLLPAQESSQ